MLKLIGATIAGVVLWAVIVTILNLGLRHGWHDYALVEKAMTFTLPMMVARLLESAAASLASGYGAARTGASGRPALFAGLIVLALFIPVHINLWAKFPIWYHLTFLASLPLLSWAGGRFGTRARAGWP